ncbi:MAG: HPF/RaiA family ribosome-associated protein [Patescibacteria group bacterium]
MKINIFTQGVELNPKERSDVEGKLAKLDKFAAEEPATLDAHFIDESGQGRKNGCDQTVHLNFLAGKERIFIEETRNHHLKAFAFAYKRLKRTLEKNHRKNVDRFRRIRGSVERIFSLIRRKR